MEKKKALQVALDPQLTHEEINRIMEKILSIEGVTGIAEEITLEHSGEK